MGEQITRLGTISGWGPPRIQVGSFLFQPTILKHRQLLIKTPSNKLFIQQILLLFPIQLPTPNVTNISNNICFPKILLNFYPIFNFLLWICHL
jgi:hypothetical protein